MNIVIKLYLVLGTFIAPDVCGKNYGDALGANSRATPSLVSQ